MSPIELGAQIINDTFTHWLPAELNSREAKIQLLATGLQESKFITRQQVGGPAHGFWQMEMGGMITGVLRSANSLVSHTTLALCAQAGIYPFPLDVYGAVLLPAGDQLACGIARLGLYLDPQPLPRAGNEAAALAYYLRTWRPGRPRLATWPEYYQLAMAVFPQ